MRAGGRLPEGTSSPHGSQARPAGRHPQPRCCKRPGPLTARATGASSLRPTSPLGRDYLHSSPRRTEAKSPRGRGATAARQRPPPPGRPSLTAAVLSAGPRRFPPSRQGSAHPPMGAPDWPSPAPAARRTARSPYSRRARWRVRPAVGRGRVHVPVGAGPAGGAAARGATGCGGRGYGAGGPCK